MFCTTPSAEFVADARRPFILNHGQAGDSLTDGFFPTILCPAGRLPIQKSGGKA